MITKKTTIIASTKNLELLRIFLDANKLPEVELGSYRITLADDPYEHDDNGNVRVEHYYHAVSLNYDSEHVDVVLTNLALINNGLNNMLVDYLKKVNAGPILMAPFSPKSATSKEVAEHFHTTIKPD